MGKPSSGARFAVVMAGGSGTRFWPWSRRRRPKQLLPIIGSRTMLQQTMARLDGVVPPERIVVVTGREHARAVHQQLPDIPADNILVEACGRNTAACIAIAAEWLHRRVSGARMAVLPADHAISDAAAFRRALRRAFALAEERAALVTLGVRPTNPETGYGYIKIGPALDRATPRAWRVDGFREKPNLTTARRFVASRRYRWNAGIFVWQVDVIRAALARFAPEIAGPIQDLTVVSRRIPASLYRRLPSLAIDVAVMEPAATANSDAIDVAVVEANFGWSDVGNWSAVRDLWKRDEHGNAVRGRALVLDGAGNTVVAGRRLVAMMGVGDLVVVDVDDALLICPAHRAQDVRKIVAELERRGQRRLL
ncbi:MAG TPA: mannose-1-phosphate guanylyltransferase [Candidatus Binatia bacterium]|nr:mannose-1-phosphate guanylyltransferase [Candidatus Binatia bacterium]